ncbi:TetR-like C-terminal domain-containing protein [Paracoccus laeviglucosivorans]|uniref:HTH-type transcriptional regulator MT1864/Rv1816-like C-terminal domain-containing protein n=1 Tax=Paracoccus laeviglucosivorans TaxID=1197861 RepID=A0A521EJD9_9RHOB|nr:TetR-like C-terminal domain-containing protein [Paracoccus laeviglucosivorans]SMO84033.1 hypothetical protein SAMN06265221_11399 [Paracoccus laeviglucosivorans]
MAYFSRRGGSLYTDAVSAVTQLGARSVRPTTADVARHLGTDEVEVSKVFPDDQRLMEAALENAMMLLHDQCVRSVVKVSADDPLAQFLALADAYIEWAHDHPQEFAILGDIPAHMTPQSGNLLRYETALHRLMMQMLLRARELGVMDDDVDPPLLIATARSFAYGVAGKMLSGNLSRWTGAATDIDAARAALHLFSRKIIKAPA